MFNNAQEFYEHLDDCVLRVVQQEEPSEAINEQHLAEVANDHSVMETLERNMIRGDPDYSVKPLDADEEDDTKEDAEFEEEVHSDHWGSSTHSSLRSGKGHIKVRDGGSS